jgi:hypothetical protein
MRAHHDHAGAVVPRFLQDLGLGVRALTDDDIDRAVADRRPNEGAYGSAPLNDLSLLNDDGARRRVAERRRHLEDRQVHAYMKYRQRRLIPRTERLGVDQRLSGRLRKIYWAQNAL